MAIEDDEMVAEMMAGAEELIMLDIAEEENDAGDHKKFALSTANGRSFNGSRGAEVVQNLMRIPMVSRARARPSRGGVRESSGGARVGTNMTRRSTARTTARRDGANAQRGHGARGRLGRTATGVVECRRTYPPPDRHSRAGDNQ